MRKALLTFVALVPMLGAPVAGHANMYAQDWANTAVGHAGTDAQDRANNTRYRGDTPAYQAERNNVDALRHHFGF